MITCIVYSDIKVQKHSRNVRKREYADNRVAAPSECKRNANTVQ